MPAATTSAPGPSEAELARLVERARALLAEADGIDEASLASEHPLRATPLLQAILAEARHLQDALPTHLPIHRRVAEIVPWVGHMRLTAGVTEYLRGLRRSDNQPWERIAVEARRRLAAFDADALSRVAPRQASKGRAEAKSRADAAEDPEDPAGPVTPPALPSLRASLLASGLPLLLVGGVTKHDKVALCRDKFQLAVQWCELPPAAPRTTRSLCERIEQGSAAAVLILHGLVSHASSDRLVKACQSAGVPFALADRGGSGAIQRALDEIDTRIAGRGTR